MGNKKYPMRIHIGKTSDGSPSILLQTSPVPPGEVWCFQTYAFENETNPTPEVRGGIERQNFSHWIFCQKNAAGGDLYWWTDDFFLIEGERFTTHFKGTSDGDQLHVYITGYRMKSKEGGIE